MVIKMSLDKDLKLLLENYSTKQQDITINDSLYYDLGIYGDDIDEFMKEFSAKFHVDISRFNLNEYFPNEQDPFISILLQIFIKKNKKKYKDLTVQHLINAIIMKKLE